MDDDNDGDDDVPVLQYAFVDPFVLLFSVQIH